MTPAEVGRQWIEAGGPLLPGMRVLIPWSVGGFATPDLAGIIVDTGGTFPGLSAYIRGVGLVGDGKDCTPNVEDAATVGAMLGAVRERYGDAGAYVSIDGMDADRPWTVWVRLDSDPDSRDGVGHGATEPAALLAAWRAAL